MWCSSCASVVEDAVMALDGVLDAEVSYAAALARVTWDPNVTNRAAIAERIDLFGYSATPARDATNSSDTADVESVFLRFFVGAAISMWIMWPTLFLLYPAYLAEDFVSPRTISLFAGALALVVLVYCGWPFLSGAWRAARVGRATMDTLVVLGTWSAWLYSAWAGLTGSGPTYFESAAMITTIVLLGRWLEALGRRDAAESLEAMAATVAAETVWWLPRAASSVAEAERRPVAEVIEGDHVVVRPGERIPVDGTVIEGTSEVDAARLTGEPMPVRVGIGDQVWTGTINLGGVMTVRVDRVGQESLSGRLAEIVEDAAFAKSRMQRLADAIAAVFVPVVIAIAFAALLITGLTSSLSDGVARAVAVLVVACPCALGLATPLAVVNAVAAGQKRGFLVRGGPAFERADDIAWVAFDKTGTLTYGMPVVSGAVGRRSLAALLELAAPLEAGDSHPVAKAIGSAADTNRRSEDQVRTDARTIGEVSRHVGSGVSGVVRLDGSDVAVAVGSERLMRDLGAEVPAELSGAAAAERATGNVVVWVARRDEVVGGIVIADQIREDARAAIEAIRARGVGVAVISGDAEPTTASVAGRLGVDHVRAEVLPADKGIAVAELGAEGGVAYVGDGINDAAALAAADLAISLRDASDVAVLGADVLLLGNSTQSTLAALPALLDTARATKRVIRENLAWAFGYNLVTIPLAVTGKLSPVTAAVAMALSSLAVVANSWRLTLPPSRARRVSTSQTARARENPAEGAAL
jgi:P-type Cu+ transporter